jgi:CBS domain-containing protein
MQVREIMTAAVASAPPETTLDEIATLMRDADTGAIPIVDDQALIGIVTDRDIVLRCVAAGKDPVETTAEDILTGEPVTVEPDDEVEAAAEIMADRKIRRLPVCEDGRLVGMLSLGDIAVKQSEDAAAGILHSVSAGVKPAAGRRRPQPLAQQAKNRVAARQDMERGDDGTARMIGSGGHSGQGIANRDVNEETRRQAKVVPFRGQSPGSGKRRVS